MLNTRKSISEASAEYEVSILKFTLKLSDKTHFEHFARFQIFEK